MHRFESFGGHEWKCEKNGLVKATIISKVGGGPERSLVDHFAHDVFQRASWNEFFAMFYRSGARLGAHWGPFGVFFLQLFAYSFRSQNSSDFGFNLGRGRRQGWGLSSMQNMQILRPVLSRPATPCRCGES